MTFAFTINQRIGLVTIVNNNSSHLIYLYLLHSILTAEVVFFLTFHKRKRAFEVNKPASVTQLVDCGAKQISFAFSQHHGECHP